VNLTFTFYTRRLSERSVFSIGNDCCYCVVQILERSLKLLFTTSDVSLVKRYVQRQCTKLLAATASVQDCIFAKEYRGIHGYQPAACVPALEIARSQLQQLISNSHLIVL